MNGQNIIVTNLLQTTIVNSREMSASFQPLI